MRSYWLSISSIVLLVYVQNISTHQIYGQYKPKKNINDNQAQVGMLWKMMCDELGKRAVGSGKTTNAYTWMANMSGKCKDMPIIKITTTTQKPPPPTLPPTVKPKKQKIIAPHNIQAKLGKKGKNFSSDLTMLQQLFQDKMKNVMGGWKKKKSQRQPGSNQLPESDIHFIQLPPAPYSYVNGLGYISQPPVFAASSLAAVAVPATKQQQQQYPSNQQLEKSPSSSVQKQRKPNVDPFIRLPVEFVSNGKPSSIYRWPLKTSSPLPQNYTEDSNNNDNQGIKQDSTIIKLNRGPYMFNGKPHNVLTLKIKRLPVKKNSF